MSGESRCSKPPLSAAQAQGVGGDEERRAGVGKKGEPEAGVAEQGEDEKDRFEREGEGDVERDDADGAMASGALARMASPTARMPWTSRWQSACGLWPPPADCARGCPECVVGQAEICAYWTGADSGVACAVSNHG